jgi:hypothetical protein
MSDRFNCKKNTINRSNCKKRGTYKGAGPVYNQFIIQERNVPNNILSKKDTSYQQCLTAYVIEVINNEISYYVECDYVE